MSFTDSTGTLVSGTYDTLETEWIFSGNTESTKFTFSSTGGGDGFAPVPEPTTFALLGIGLVGLAGAGIRKQRNRNKKS